MEREFIYMKKPGWYWRNPKAPIKYEQPYLPVWWVRHPTHESLKCLQTSPLVAHYTDQHRWHLPMQTRAVSVNLLVTFASPPPRWLAVPEDWTSLTQEINKHTQGSGSKFKVVPTLPRQRTPTSLTVNRSALLPPFSLDFASLHLWGTSDTNPPTEYESTEEKSQQTQTSSAYSVIQVLWVILVSLHLFFFMQFYRYYRGGKLAFRIENKIKQDQ